MKKNPLIFLLTLIYAVSCSNTTEPTFKSMVIVNPVHSHVNMVLGQNVPGISDTIHVFAPEGEELSQFQKFFESNNSNTRHWIEDLHICENCMDSVKEAKKGDFVVLASPNPTKAQYILSSIQKGYDVIADKPLAINEDGYETLVKAYELASKKDLIIFDMMTERYDLLNRTARLLLSNKDFFGKLDSVSFSNVHHFLKWHNGETLVRPKWYYDVKQQGEGIADVSTHLIDLIFWECFPGEEITTNDVVLEGAEHYPTEITLDQYKLSTKADSFPDYLDDCIKDGKLYVMANGHIDFKVKGIPARVSVEWGYEAPKGSGDRVQSLFKGSKATIRFIQNETTNFKKILVIDSSDENIENLKKWLDASHPEVIITKRDEGNWTVSLTKEYISSQKGSIDPTYKTFLEYADSREVPKWEATNTLTKYYLIKEAVKLVQNKQ